MQIIIPTALTPEQYAQAEYHKQVKPSSQCPNCRAPGASEALGYYWRGVTQSIASVLVIGVRRFKCGMCGISVSCLPKFAQPYRLVNTQTIQAGFQGQRPEQVQRWMHLIRAYWRSFQAHLPRLLGKVGHWFGAVSLKAGVEDFWKLLLQQHGDLGVATQELVDRFHTCLFGHYRCHQPKLSRVK